MEKEKVLKLIDEVSGVLSILIELKKKGKFQEALAKIDETLLKYFDFDAGLICSISEDFLMDVLKEKKGLSIDQLATIADILSEKGDILLEQNNLKESQKVLKNTLKIYYFLNDDQDFFSFKNMNKMLLVNEKLSRINVKIES